MSLHQSQLAEKGALKVYWVCLRSMVAFRINVVGYEPWHGLRAYSSSPGQLPACNPLQRLSSATHMEHGEKSFLNSHSAFFATLQMLLKTKALPRKPITTQSTPLP